MTIFSFRRAVPASFLCALAACGAGVPADWDGIDTSYVSPSSFNNQVDQMAADLVDTAFTPVATSVPTSGTADYSGQLGFDYYGYYVGTVIGDMDVSVDFASNEMNGTVTNMVVGDVSHDQAYRTPGELDVTGTQTGATFTGNASGTFLINEYGYETPVAVSASLVGDFHAPSSTTLTPGAISGVGNGTMDGVFGDSSMDIFLYGTKN